MIPDTYRVARDGDVLERTAGLKRIAMRSRSDGGTYEEDIDKVRAEALTLDDDQLAQLDRLAQHCEQVYGNARDIEWAISDGTLYLLQCRAVTTSTSKSAAIDPTAAVADQRPRRRAPRGAVVRGDVRRRGGATGDAVQGAAVRSR